MASKSPFAAKVKDEAVTTWVRLSLVAEVNLTEWTTKGETRHPYICKVDKRAEGASMKAALVQRPDAPACGTGRGGEGKRSNS